MKRLHLIMTLLCLLFFCKGIAQNTEIAMDEKGNQIWKGNIALSALAANPDFGWYAENKKNYTPDPKAVEVLRNHKETIYLVIFGGTWCDDTHHVLPHYIAWIEAAAFPENHLTIIGVDRQKTSVGNLSKTMNITNVPTAIVFEGGKELGRVLEFGETGDPIAEVAKIIETSAHPSK